MEKNVSALKNQPVLSFGSHEARSAAANAPPLASLACV